MAGIGVTGPIGKRSEELVRRNLKEPIDKVEMIGDVVIPKLGIPNAHPMVQDLYDSLKDSGQAKWYEPSDWEYARVTFHFLNKLLKSTKPSAQMLAAVSSMMTVLIMTEGDRRRVRMEVERSTTNGSAGVATVTSIADVYKERLKTAEQQA